MTGVSSLWSESRSAWASVFGFLRRPRLTEYTDEESHDFAVARLRRQAEELFEAGVAAAEPRRLVVDALEQDGAFVVEPIRRSGLTLLIGIGKAAPAMARGALEVLAARGRRLDAGIIATDRSNFRELQGCEVFASGHPIPDHGALRAAARIDWLLHNVGPADLVLVLVSGGGSAMLTAPAEGIDLAAKAHATKLLLLGGASVRELNVVRKHLSRFKGGQLAMLAAPAHVESLILSDVTGGELDAIASGPTVADPCTFADALGVIERYELRQRVAPEVLRHLEQGVAGAIAETPKPGDERLATVHNRVLWSNRSSVLVVAARARAFGFETHVLEQPVVGEAREQALMLLERARGLGEGRNALIAGGETTVTVRGAGRGGRNQELALALALDERRSPLQRPWALLSAGTDGIDGPTDAAGAIVDCYTLERARGLDGEQELLRNNSNGLLEAAGDLLVTGPTGTNVADLMILLVS